MKKISTEVIEKENVKVLEVVLGGDVFYLPFKLLGGRWVGFLDISGQFVLIECAAGLLVEMLEQSGAEFDTILNPVSKSNALAHAIAVRWSEKHPGMTHTVVARKGSDASNPVKSSYRSITTPKDQTLSLTPDDAAFIKGKRILLVDDVFGGGGTTKALKEMAALAGAEVSAHAVIAVEQGASFPANLCYLFELPVLDD